MVNSDPNFSNNIRSQAIAKNDTNFLKENILFRFVLVIIATGVIVFTDLTSTLTNSQQGSFFLKLFQ